MSQQGLLILHPMAVTDALLASTDVPEADAPLWSAATTYQVGDLVMLAATHSIYENSLANNLGKSPDAHPDVWTRVKATNRWRCLDRNTSARTAQASGMSYVFAAGVAVAMAGVVDLVDCHSVRVRLVDPVYGTVYDATRETGMLPVAPDPWEWAFGEWTPGATLGIFEGIPSFPAAALHVDLVGGADLAVGHLMFGRPRLWGVGVSWGLRLRREMYSKIEPSPYGDLQLLKRPTARAPSFEVLLRRSELDPLQQFLDAIDAQVCLFVVSDLWESMTVVGVVSSAESLPKSLAEIYLNMELLGVV